MDVRKDERSLNYNTILTCAWKEQQEPQNS